MLLRMLGNSLVTSEEYLRTMPKLFEYAAKPEGGFDRDFLQVAFIEFDNTAKRMDTRSLTMLLVGPQEDAKTRYAYLGRAYGRIETIKELIWDDFLMEDKKRQLVQSARHEIRYRYDQILPDLDEPI